MQFDLYPASENSSTVIRSFYGLNRSRRASRGELEDMKNMSSAEYPCAAPRGRREIIAPVPGQVRAVCAPDSTDTDAVTGFTGIAQESFYYNGDIKSRGFRLDAARTWEIIRMGNLYIMNGFLNSAGKMTSELYCYNVDTGEFCDASDPMDNLIVTSGKNETGNYLSVFRYGFDDVYNYSCTAPDGTVINNSEFFDRYASGGLSFGSENIFEKHFAAGDEVTIEGFPSSSENTGQLWTYAGVTGDVTPQPGLDFSLNNTVNTDTLASLGALTRRAVTDAYVSSFEVKKQSLEGRTIYVHYIYFKLFNKNGDEIDFDNMSGVYCSGVRLSRRRRVFDHICARHNRLWGTAPTGNMLYASASDDIFSFTAADISAGYAARLTCDTPSSFTAICGYNGDAVAFKEDSITVISGTNPLNYGSYTIYGTGCIDARSVALTPQGIIFLGRGGFYIFAGNEPVCISEKLRSDFDGAAAGYDGTVYYACTEKDGEKLLMTYDTRRRVWHIEDDTAAAGFFRFRGGFYMADGNSLMRLTAEPDSGVEWSFTTVRQTGGDLDNVAVNEIWILADVAKGASFAVETSVDGGEFAMHSRFCEPGLHVFRCPVRAVMGSSWRCRLSGTGFTAVYELEFRTAAGGRRYKERNM